MVKMVVLHGEPRVEVKLLNKETAEVSVFCDIASGNTHYADLALLRLTLTMCDGGDVYYVDAEDDYSYYPPYLKPVPSFRKWLEKILFDVAEKYRDNLLVKEGLENYIKNLQSFSEEQSLLRQVKTAVNSRRFSKKDFNLGSEKLRQILNLLGETPTTDNQFVVK